MSPVALVQVGATPTVIADRFHNFGRASSRHVFANALSRLASIFSKPSVNFLSASASRSSGGGATGGFVARAARLAAARQLASHWLARGSPKSKSVAETPSAACTALPPESAAFTVANDVCIRDRKRSIGFVT